MQSGFLRLAGLPENDALVAQLQAQVAGLSAQLGQLLEVTSRTQFICMQSMPRGAAQLHAMDVMGPTDGADAADDMFDDDIRD